MAGIVVGRGVQVVTREEIDVAVDSHQTRTVTELAVVRNVNDLVHVLDAAHEVDDLDHGASVDRTGGDPGQGPEIDARTDHGDAPGRAPGPGVAAVVRDRADTEKITQGCVFLLLYTHTHTLAQAHIHT